MAYCARYKAKTGDTSFEAEAQKRLKSLFPEGMESVSLANFREQPSDGVLIKGQNELTRTAGLKRGNVIVALNGIRTRTFTQYNFLRDSLTTPELNLIVWQGGVYREIKANPPNHRFGVEFGDYRPQ